MDKAEQWIKDRSAKYVFELKEEKGVSFEWFLSDDNTEATLIESYTDSDGAKKTFRKPCCKSYSYRGFGAF